MTDNMKMMGRYLLAIAISYAVGKGWITPAAGSVLTDFVVQLVGLIIAFAPAIYAAWKVDNGPRPT